MKIKLRSFAKTQQVPVKYVYQICCIDQNFIGSVNIIGISP